MLSPVRAFRRLFTRRPSSPVQKHRRIRPLFE